MEGKARPREQLRALGAELTLPSGARAT